MKIRCNSNRTICFVIEPTEGLPANKLIERSVICQKNSYKIFSTSCALSAMPEEADFIVAFIKNSKMHKELHNFFDKDNAIKKIIPDGYGIFQLQKRDRRFLVVVGGNLFGMLAGLFDVLCWSRLEKDALIYEGGERIENPAFPLRYYWTWDHSTNWVLDDEGNQIDGCSNPYLKAPDTFLKDYRKLIDFCVAMRFNGLVIWGFLRDSHGGEKYAYEVAKYAKERGVALMPGVGLTAYNGIYYEGEHPYNIGTYLKKHPEMGLMNEQGKRSSGSFSPYAAGYTKWVQKALEWLVNSFPIGGVNLENGDFLVDHSPLAKKMRLRLKTGEADAFKDQYAAYKPALEFLQKIMPDGWNVYATYAGFAPQPSEKLAGYEVNIGCKKPYFASHLPESAIAQWTITGLLSKPHIPLKLWMENDKPEAIYRNARWQKGLIPPTKRSAAFIHQASQWDERRRYMLAISHFAEACLRCYEAGFEGISIHGEVSERVLTAKLNYLAMRHWTYHPVSTLEDFANAELARLLGSRTDALIFLQKICDLDSCTLTDNAYAEIYPFIKKNHPNFSSSYNNKALEICKMWNELGEWIGNKKIIGGISLI